MNFIKVENPILLIFIFFGCKYFVLNNGKDNIGKFDVKYDEGIFLSYSPISKP